MKLKDKYGDWALITGASSGIGLEFAKQLAQQGINLVLVARRETLLQRLGQQLEQQYGITTRSIAVDFAAEGAATHLAEQVHDLEIGLLIPAAGVDEMGQFLDKDYADLERMLTINVNAPTALTHTFGRKMAQRKRGGIILVSSLFAYQGIPNFSTYAASKAYILLLGEALNVELGAQGVDVLVLSPGLTDTPFSQAMDINFKLLPMIAQQPRSVARVGLRNLGRNASVVSGLLNKFYAWENRLMPRSWPVNLFGFLISNAIKSFKRKTAKAN